MGVRLRACFAIATAVASYLLTATASARIPWPQPAAGESASGGPEVIFTFDDGPWESTTGKVLDILGAHNIKAIFFLVGRQFQRGHIQPHLALAARIVRDGHIVGNHSMSHAQFCGLDAARLDVEIGGARQLLEEITHLPTPWYRVPYGSRCRNIEAALLRHGTSHFHWDIDPQEWQGKTWKATAASVIRRLARLEGRAVLLMHDTKATTTLALPAILGWIDTENTRRKALGLRPIRIVSAPELAAERVHETLSWLAMAGATARGWVDLALIPNIP